MGNDEITSYREGLSPDSKDGPYMKSGIPSAHRLGVAYHAPWDRPDDGFSEHARRCARALALTGCPVHLRNLAGRGIFSSTPRTIPDDIAHLVTASISTYSAQIHQIILRESTVQALTSHQYMPHSELKFANSRRVIYSVWERNRIDDGTARALNRVGQVWTACHANADMLIASGVDPDRVFVLHVPYFPDDPLLIRAARVSGVPRFYHIGKWEPRKAQDQIILSFMHAFKPGQAALIMRSAGLMTPVSDYPPSPKEWISYLLQFDPVVKDNGWTADNFGGSIELIDKQLTRAEIVRLHAFGDVYVTLSRGEGFDMPAFDAKLAGNRVIYTKSGGPQDFCFPHHGDIPIQTCGTVQCNQFYGWESDARYIDYDWHDVVDEMRNVAAKRMEKLDADTTKFNMRSFDAKHVGEYMLGYLSFLCGDSRNVFGDPK